MKKMMLCAFALCLPLALFGGCSPKGVAVVAATYPYYVAALNVAGDVPGVTVACLTPPDAAVRGDYALSEEERERLRAADIVIVGGEMPFLEGELGGKRVIDASEGFSMPSGDGGDGAPPGAGAMYVAPEGAIYGAERVRDGLAQFDPARAEAYGANALGYINSLLELQSNMHASLAPYRGVKAVMPEAFVFFAREFRLSVAATLPEGEPGDGDRALAEEAVRAGALAVFSDMRYDAPWQEAFTLKTGVAVVRLDPAATGELDNKNAYLEAMDYNTLAIAVALGYAGE